MTKARTPAGSGAEYLNSSQVPTSITWPTVPSTANRLMDLVREVKFRDVADSTANFTYTFSAPNNGHVTSLRAVNGSTAADGTNGIKLVVTNESNSSEVVASFGIGSGSNAAAGTNTVSSLSASTATEIASTTAKNFNKGDILKVTATRDGTAITLSGTLVLEFYVPGTADD